MVEHPSPPVAAHRGAEPDRPRVEVAPLPPPEASSRLSQLLMLGLSVLLLAIAAVVFVGVISDLEPWSQLAILLAVVALALSVALPVAHRGLTSTAESVAAVGLLVVCIAGYALWTTGIAGELPRTTYTGLVAAATAAIGYGYHQLSRLEVPRWGAVLAAQPVLPLLLYPAITGTAGWALAFALVAAQNAMVARMTGRRPLGYLAVGLHVAAVLLALGYAVAGLFLAGEIPVAAPAGLTLILAAAVGAVGAYALRVDPWPTVASALLALAVIVATARVLAMALPGRSLLPVTVVAAVAALVVRLLPVNLRRGPLWGVIVAFAGLGVVVAGLAVRVGVAAVVWPPWPEGLSEHRQTLAEVAAGAAGWQLAPTAAALTIGAAVALPTAKRESTVAGVTLTALAIPASLAVSSTVAPWLLALAAAALALTGLDATSRRAALVHTIGASLAGVAAAGTALANPALTAAILAGLTATGLVVAGARPRHPAAELVTGWAGGAFTLLLPGAVAAAAVAAGFGTPAALTAVFAAICGSLAYAAAAQLRDRTVPVPVQVGLAVATIAVVVTAATIEGTTLPDRLVAGLVLLTAVLVLTAPRVDGLRRPIPGLDGADLAAAALTVSVIATLARLTVLVLPITGPDAALAAMAALVFLVALAVRAMPVHLRRGPVIAVAGVGALVAAVGAAAAIFAAARVLSMPAPLGESDLSGWWPPESTVGGLGWAPPYALALLAVAAWLVLPAHTPARPRASAALMVLATVSAPVAWGLAWWTPAMLSVAIGVGYGLWAVLPPVIPSVQPARRLRIGSGGSTPDSVSDQTPAPASPPAEAPAVVGSQAAAARALAGGVLVGYAVGAALARPWLTALVLGTAATFATLVALVAARCGSDLVPAPPVGPPTGRPTGQSTGQFTGQFSRPSTGFAAVRTQLRIGGTAVAGALLAVPAAIAALAAHHGLPAAPALLAALAGASLGLAVLAALPATPAAVRYLPYGTAGITAAAAAVALVALIRSHPADMYAAGAVLLAVLAELLRAARRPPGNPGLVRPTVGALIATAVPALIAVLALAPALATALISPYQTFGGVWQGPPEALIGVGAEVGAGFGATAQPSSVIAALLLTLAAALAAVGFGQAEAGQAVPLVAPGLAVTMLLAPDALGAPWPAATVAALLVFVISVLGVALTPPPHAPPPHAPPPHAPPPHAPPAVSRSAGRVRAIRPLRVARSLVLAIGIAAGGAGLADALADPQLTWTTFGGFILVGMAAGLAGQTAFARRVGWVGAVLAAQLFAFTTAVLFGANLPQTGFALLVVGALALLVVPRLPRMRQPALAVELRTVEILGGYGSLLLALATAIGAPAQLAAVLIAGGAVVGGSAVRSGLTHSARRVSWWAAAVAEVAGIWVIMRLLEVGLLEAYTLPFAVFALLIGVLEVRYRPDLGSWVTWGPGLIAALGPSLALVLTTTSAQPARQAWVLIGGVATLTLGSRLSQRAPLIIGAVVTALGALHLLSLAGPWLVLIPLGLLLLVLGANRERRARDLRRLRGAYYRMR